MTKDVALRAPSGEVLHSTSAYARWGMQQRINYARTIAGARALLPGGLAAGTPDQTAANVFLVLETGDMLGLHPMAALGGIDVIEGNPTISPQLALGLIRDAGHKVRFEETGTVEGGDLRVTVTAIRSDDPEFPIVKSFSLHDAARAGLCEYTQAPNGIWSVKARSKNGNPLNWEKWPGDMTQWRAVGRLMRAGMSDVMLGVSYFPEELEATVNSEGVRTAAIDAETEEKLKAEFKSFDDKADMETFYHRIQRAEQWTDSLRIAFDAHLATLTKDSRLPKDVPAGAPGHTGDAAIDEPAPEPDEDDVHEPVDAEVIDDAAPEAQPVSEAQAAAPVVIVESVEDRQAREEAEFEAASAAEFAAAQERAE